MFSAQPLEDAAGAANRHRRSVTTVGTSPLQAIIAINKRIDRPLAPHGIDETMIEDLLFQLDGFRDPALPEYWLLLARMAEMALLCAGYHADHCAFTAAGDLFVNPRSVLIYQKGHQTPLKKPRHSCVTETLGLSDAPEAVRRHRLLYETCTRMATGPNLPEMINRMQRSGHFSKNQLDRLEKRIAKVAATIGFLTAWGLTGPEGLHRKRETPSDETRQFFTSHLCRFDDAVFQQLAEELRQSAKRDSDSGGGTVLR